MMMLEESLVRQRNKMMEKIAQILQQLPTRDAYSSRGHENPFKVHVNFDIPLFEELMDSNDLDKWMNLLEGYFSVQIFFDRENITFALLKDVPHVKGWWDTYSEQRAIEEYAIFAVSPTWDVGQLRGGGVNQLLPFLNNYAYFKLFAEHLMTITIMQGGKK
jgi:hypothetical protein